MSELAELKAQRDSLLSEIAEIDRVADENRILEAIDKQRWYFFKNKPKVLVDRLTGFLWANLDHYPYLSDYSVPELRAFERKTGFDGWDIPSMEEFKFMIFDKTFPFRTVNKWYINDMRDWKTKECYIRLDTLDSIGPGGGFIPVNRSLVAGKPDYSRNDSPRVPLNIFVENGLWPIFFNNDKDTELFGKMYIEKAKLVAELQKLDDKIKALGGQLKELDDKINSLQATRTLSSEFDYTLKLSEYDVPAIDSSVIKYFQALQRWTDGLMSMIEDFEREKEDVIRQSGIVTLHLSKKYEDSPNLTTEENDLLRERLAFFLKSLSLGMNTLKERILSVKRQADELEARIDSTDELTALAEIQDERRASFPLVAENTARIITDALRKIEFFEEHRNFVSSAVKILTEWTENYRVFKTTLIGQLKDSCVKDGIEEEVYSVWFANWESIRLRIEKKIKPLLEWGLKYDVPVNETNEKSIPERIIAVLDEYRKSIDAFFVNERKGIHQKFAFVPGGGLQEKFEAESHLYKCTSELQSSLQEIIFSCTSPADRIFILKWTDELLDIQIDEILAFVADNGLDKISAEILDGFSALRQKNYDVYLSDAKAYSEELSRRDSEYNSLMFRMRKGLTEKTEG